MVFLPGIARTTNSILIVVAPKVYSETTNKKDIAEWLCDRVQYYIWAFGVKFH